MPVLPKNLLKLLFESGDLITETTLDDLINATYNPTLIAGAGIFLSEVSTPAGTDITTSVTGASAGTVTSVSATNSAFINTTVINPTTTPSLQSVLSATGTPSASTFLRGDNTWATAGSGSVTSVGLSMPTAFTITNSPVTSAGTLTVTGAGTTLEYIDGTGALQTFPAIGGTYTNSALTLVDFPSSANPNIPAGSNFTAQTFTEMMNKMLYPTLNPTISQPSNSFNLTQSGFQEIGLITALNFTQTFNRGTINPVYFGGPSNTSGTSSVYNYTGTGVNNQPSTTSPNTQTVASYTVLSGTQTWTGSVTYLAGQMPLDSNGDDFNPPGALPAGTTSPAKTVSINGVYPVFATSSNPATVTKQSLQTMTSTIVIDFTASTATDPNILEIPAVWSTLTQVQVFNTTFNTWNNYGPGMANFLPYTPFNQMIQGVSVPYLRYTNSTGSSIPPQKCSASG